MVNFSKGKHILKHHENGKFKFTSMADFLPDKRHAASIFETHEFFPDCSNCMASTRQRMLLARTTKRNYLKKNDNVKDSRA